MNFRLAQRPANAGRPLNTTATVTGEFRRAADLSDDELARIVHGLPPVLALQALPVPQAVDEHTSDRA
jgi:hypothetical protein